MSMLNKDVLLLILEELQYDSKSLYSCLLVNRTWCETAVPILWKNPHWKLKENGGDIQYLEEKSLNIQCLKEKREKREILQFNVIISHLSNETKENLRNQGINLSTEIQKPLFNYISFCKHLVISKLEEGISSIKNIKSSKISILRNEVFKLFINKNTRFTHLYIPRQFNYHIHLIPGAEYCFSELKYLFCSTESTDQNILEGLSRISNSIKELVIVPSNNILGMVKLIEAQKNINYIRFYYYTNTINESFHKSLENSLIKHADNVRHLNISWEPITKILSYFVNLISLEMWYIGNWKHLENASLPGLKFLKVYWAPSNSLASLIENTKGNLIEISINCGRDRGDEEAASKRLIQAIYRNCPKLKYLKILFRNINILELENLLINCQYLNGLIIVTNFYDMIDWDNLFKILAKSSPNSLFKFKFYSYRQIKSDSLKLFFDSWKDRHPMLLQTVNDYMTTNYKAGEIIKKRNKNYLEDFEWFHY
ncbi:hypothetical protein C1645_875422 [Glomus cerebriforme]|uniref:F-box domain-containing protein n=1 Tax=Glomus cerebriforme TaxID=658196 RepID=A0A397SZD2_9GLOM|nr:hypothetical protein C1645_875422 [Glomus cerebriforme]